MAEESDLEKTEPASQQRLDKAREEGTVVRSRELSTFLMLGTAFVGLWITSGPMVRAMDTGLRSALQFDRRAAFEPAQMAVQFAGLTFDALLAMLPLFGMLVLMAVAGPMLLGGWLLSAKAVAPKFSKLNPFSGLVRMVSSHALAELVKALAKTLLVGGVGYWVIKDNFDSVLALMAQPASVALRDAIWLVARSCALIALALLVVALIDVPWQLWTHFRKLRMSREELRQEHKESEGDPHIKSQIKRLQQQASRRRMMAEVPKADIIVTNPTHFAVALRYIDKDMRAPRVVAKGTDLVALRIRELAAENGVPILEAPALTRSLYKHTLLGSEIPAGLYTAVAEVLAWVYQLRRWKEEGGDAPRAPVDLPVPAELEMPAVTA